MSVFVPTGATVAVDPLDVLLVAPNGSTSTTLYLAQGQPVVVAALPAAVVAELNTAAGLVGPDTLFTTPVAASEWPSPVYIAGAQVKRVQPSGATNLGSMVLFALSGFMVTVPTVDLSDMVDAINDCATPGGGGVIPHGDWTPTLTPAAGTDAEIADGGRGSFIASGTNPGDVAIASIVLEVTTDAGQVMNVTVGMEGLPVPADGLTVVPLAQIFVQSGDEGYPVTLQPLNGTTFVLSSNDATTLETTILALITVTYQVDVS